MTPPNRGLRTRHREARRSTARNIGTQLTTVPDEAKTDVDKELANLDQQITEAYQKLRDLDGGHTPGRLLRRQRDHESVEGEAGGDDRTDRRRHRTRRGPPGRARRARRLHPDRAHERDRRSGRPGAAMATTRAPVPAPALPARAARASSSPPTGPSPRTTRTSPPYSRM
ncbi:hypothetical protein ACRAWF_19775 [Streptomyces sp. L7]